MKKIFFTPALAMLCFLISCKDSTTTSTTGNDQNAKNLENNRKVMKAIETGDSATINALIADDAVDHQGPKGMDIKGGDSIRHMLIDMHNHMKDLKLDVIADAANGDYIFSLATLKGTCTDGSMGMPAGTQMNEKTVDVVKVTKDGKMTEHWGFLDAQEVMKKQMNMPPMDYKMDNGKMNNGKMDNKMEHKDTTKKM